MSNSIVVSADKAEKINELISEKLAKHLFVFCNYNPESIEVYSEDARFIKAALNIYKALIDSSFCNNLYRLCQTYGIRYDYQKLKNNIEIVKSIRTVIGHNTDYRNGDEESREILKKWVYGIIGTSSPQTSSEFEKLEKELEKIGDDSIDIIEIIINECEKSKNIQEIISDWEQLIIGFYKRPNSKNIIEGQIRLAYLSRLGKGQNINKIQIAEWVRKMFFYKEEEQISNLREIPKGKAFSNQVLKNINDKIEENQRVIDERNKNIADQLKKDASILSSHDYSDFYISTIPDKIEKRLEEGNVESLLPQDIVQQIIEIDFNDVPV